MRLLFQKGCYYTEPDFYIITTLDIWMRRVLLEARVILAVSFRVNQALKCLKNPQKLHKRLMAEVSFDTTSPQHLPASFQQSLWGTKRKLRQSSFVIVFLVKQRGKQSSVRLHNSIKKSNSLHARVEPDISTSLWYVLKNVKMVFPNLFILAWNYSKYIQNINAEPYWW